MISNASSPSPRSTTSSPWQRDEKSGSPSTFLTELEADDEVNGEGEDDELEKASVEDAAHEDEEEEQTESAFAGRGVVETQPPVKDTSTASLDSFGQGEGEAEATGTADISFDVPRIRFTPLQNDSSDDSLDAGFDRLNIKYLGTLYAGKIVPLYTSVATNRAFCRWIRDG